MPTIETARLRLRLFTLDDTDAYYQAIMRDPDVQRFLPSGQPQPRDHAESTLRFFIDYWGAHQMGGFAIIQQADDTLIGQCGLQYIPGAEDEVEVYYALAKAYWSQGTSNVLRT